MACEDCKTAEDCGCQQEALRINQVCNPIECPNGQCSESFDASCIIYTGADVVDANGVVIATSGNNMAQVFANLAAMMGATNNAVEGIYVNATGTGNVNDPDTDTLVLADTVTKNKLAADGNQLYVDLIFDANTVGSVRIKTTLGSFTHNETLNVVGIFNGKMRFTATRIDNENVLMESEITYVDPDSTVKRTFARKNQLFDSTINQPLAVNILALSAGADQINVKRISWGVKTF